MNRPGEEIPFDLFPDADEGYEYELSDLDDIEIDSCSICGTGIGAHGAGCAIWTHKSKQETPMSNPIQDNRCRCGAALPTVADDETPYQFCSEECKQEETQ